MVKHRGICFKEKKEGISVNKKKWRILPKKVGIEINRCGNEKEDEESVLTDEMKLEENFNSVDF